MFPWTLPDSKTLHGCIVFSSKVFNVTQKKHPISSHTLKSAPFLHFSSVLLLQLGHFQVLLGLVHWCQAVGRSRGPCLDGLVELGQALSKTLLELGHHHGVEGAAVCGFLQDAGGQGRHQAGLRGKIQKEWFRIVEPWKMENLLTTVVKHGFAI